MGIYGQDWSSYQSASPSTSGLSFVFLKVTEGLGYVNPVWQSQYDTARNAGLVVGFYHYPHMHNSASSEADYFLSQVTPKPGEVVVLDWEGYDSANSSVSAADQLAYKEAYLSYMKSKLPNNPVGMYCNTDYWVNVDTTSHTGDFLWIATAGRAAGDPGIQHSWVFHQYDASGVDRDYCAFATKQDLINWTQSFENGTSNMPLTSADVNAVAKATADLVTSGPYRDQIAFATWWWFTKAFDNAGAAPVDGLWQDTYPVFQQALHANLAKLDPSVLTQIQDAVTAAIKSATVNVTVDINGAPVTKA